MEEKFFFCTYHNYFLASFRQLTKDVLSNVIKWKKKFKKRKKFFSFEKPEYYIKMANFIRKCNEKGIKTMNFALLS